MSGSYHIPGMHMIRPEVKSRTVDLGPTAALYMPEFTTAREYADAKIKILKEQFYIQLTKEEVLHLRSLKTENEINAAARSIINKHWE